jgi:hypothetical protein
MMQNIDGTLDEECSNSMTLMTLVHVLLNFEQI